MEQTKTVLTARQVEPCLYLQFGTLGQMKLVGDEPSNLARDLVEPGPNSLKAPFCKLALQH
jgi:hypothetical protein